jgi:glycosyltransferase involved in cell wall biosynthesis
MIARTHDLPITRQAKALNAGHRSIVLACEGSRIAGELIAGEAPQGTIDGVSQASTSTPILPPVGLPVLVTLHLPIDWYLADALRPCRPNTWLQCVSDTQKSSHTGGPQVLPPIENGVAVDLLAARHAKRRFALVLGRICPEKGVHLAMEAAAKADMPPLGLKRFLMVFDILSSGTD